MTASDEEVFAKFPKVLIDQDNIEHYRAMLDRRLVINRCDDCGYWIYPHRPMCPKCWSVRITPTEVSGKGKVFMLTRLHQGRPIPGVDYSTPHLAVAIELEERDGLRYLSTVVNCKDEDVYLGMPVEMTWTERNGVPARVFPPRAA
jgi:uncharacterized OB-fold protein